MNRLNALVFLVLLVLTGCSSAPQKPADVALIQPPIQQRVDDWHALIDAGQHWPDRRRLQQTNAFINQLVFVDDKHHWGQEDFWATPLQTLVSGGGDCEDFAIAKYVTLARMGINEEKLRLTYVKARTLNQAHMVVSYYADNTAMPLVLDNLNTLILPASERDDLTPVYSFNANGLWLNKPLHQLEWVNSSQQIAPWQTVLRNIRLDEAQQQKMICRYQYDNLPAAEADARCQKSGK